MKDSISKPPDLALSRIKFVGIDVDGVLTDGMKHYTKQGLSQLSFSARDGLGIHMLLMAGIKVALLSHGCTDIVKKRADDLGIEMVYEGLHNKGDVLVSLQKSLNVSVDETLYAGDDLWDIVAFEHASIRVAVADAVEAVKKSANWLLKSCGGNDAVREISDAIIEAKELNPLELIQGTGHSSTKLNKL